MGECCTARGAMEKKRYAGTVLRRIGLAVMCVAALTAASSPAPAATSVFESAPTEPRAVTVQAFGTHPRTTCNCTYSSESYYRLSSGSEWPSFTELFEQLRPRANRSPTERQRSRTASFEAGTEASKA